MSENVVAKWGGGPMAYPEVVAGIISDRSDQRLGVVSASGRGNGSLDKMTDLLLYYGAGILDVEPAMVISDQRALGRFTGEFGALSPEARKIAILDNIVDQYDTRYNALDSRVRRQLRNVTADQLRSQEELTLPYFASRGEYLSARYLSARLEARFADAYCIRFHDDTYLPAETYKKIGMAVAGNFFVDGRSTITPGFYGFDQNGRVRLLGRGSSDRVAVIYAVAFGWDNENWTNVDGILTADPDIVGKDKVELNLELTREEVREGAHGGSGVLAGDTILDVDGSAITITVRNAFNTNCPGTRIVADASQLKKRIIDSERPVVSVTGRALLELTVRDMGMAHKLGYVPDMLHRAAELGISIEHLPSAQDAFTVTLHDRVDADALAEFKKSAEFHTISRSASVNVDEKGVVYLVGEALKNSMTLTRTTGRIGLLLYGLGLPIETIVSHHTSPSLAYLAERKHVIPLVAALHEEFVERQAT